MKKVWPRSGDRVVKSSGLLKVSRVGAGSVGSEAPRKTPTKKPDRLVWTMPEIPPKELISEEKPVLPSPLLGKPGVRDTVPVTSVTWRVRPLPGANENEGGSVPPLPPPGAGGVGCPAPKMFAVA